MIPNTYCALSDPSQATQEQTGCTGHAERRWSGVIWLIFSGASVGLGNSLEPISALVFLHPFLLIIGFEKMFYEISKTGCSIR
jgi:hypothetical protein